MIAVFDPKTRLVKTVSYDDLGDITNKSDLADPNGGTGTYTYGTAHQPPHAVRSISGTVNGVANPSFKYDADGNLTCEYTGTNCGGGAVTKETDAYWSFNMTHTISDGATSLTLTYDSEHARIVQALTTASTTTTTSYLNDAVSGAMSEKVTSGSSTTWNDYLMVDGRLVGERINNASGTSWQYFILDHLGSVAIVTDGTPGSSTLGKVLTTGGRLSFDAWGKQRYANGNDDPTCSQGLTSPTTRGFTSQEDIAALCLVNLNARLYDPSMGRFLSADSFVADPTDPQAYNRYTYVSNRPLSLTDPTGHEEDGPECIGSCGTYNPGSQADGTNSTAHPEMEVLGDFAISESGNLDEGVNAIHITYNVSGESIASQDPTKGEVSMSARNDESQTQSNSDPKTTAQTASAQNTEVNEAVPVEISDRFNKDLIDAGVSLHYDASSGTKRMIETVIVTADLQAAQAKTPQLGYTAQAMDLFRNDVALGKETDFVRVQRGANGHINVTTIPGLPCNPPSGHCMNTPDVDPALGDLLFDTHIHFNDPSPYSPGPSPSDVITSANSGHPGVIYQNVNGAPQQVIYQGAKCGLVRPC